MTIDFEAMSAFDLKMYRDRLKAHGEVAIKLRKFADLVEVTAPGLTGMWSATSGCYYHPGPYGQVKTDLARWVKLMLAEGATIKKVADQQDASPWSTMTVEAMFDEDSEWAVVGSVTALMSRREVCERVVVATETVTETVPDPEVVEAARATAPMVEVTNTVERVEWRCHPIMAGE